MTRKQALAILELQEGVALEEIKRAYRRLAFALHPDLHPENPNAGKAFQALNEAYVFLSSPDVSYESVRSAPGETAGSRAGAEAAERVRAEARRAYANAKERFRREDATKTAKTSPQPGGAGKAREMKRDDVLRDLLRDPFARRVFEDIYNQIRNDVSRKATGARGNPRGRRAADAFGGVPDEPGFLGKTADTVSDWFRRQIDEEQTVRFSGSLTPGARVRLQVHHGVFGKPKTIELTLPPEFEPGRPIRLKGLGKRIGKWRGDLYLRILGL